MHLLYSDHAIWLLCAVFYLSDQVRYAGANALLVGEGRKGWAPIIPHYRFLILNRAFTVLNPLTPWATAITLPWLSTGEAMPRDIHRQQRRVKVVTARLANIRAAASVVCVSLFVIGPVATESSGLSFAILIVAPVLIAMWVGVAIPLILYRGCLGLPLGSLIWILIECAICPGYFANLWRRLLVRRLSSSTDAVIFCSATMNERQQAKLLVQLELYFDDLSERDLLTDADEVSFTKYGHALKRSSLL
ncbi:hypothetical protein SAMN02990966_06124 [Rhodospirillales bacterium URHD0017]|nr:hypothetical protein SAMN02990966_06124 [Rhodospirillales bacterium URHD0017]